jgi:hypothetical protein
MTEKLPNFLIIGSAKSGTTSLHHYLSSHPDIFMPHEKEIHFFLKDDEVWGTWNRGVKWYASLFAAATSEKMLGEASPGYTIDSQTVCASSKIKKVLCKPKLIYLVRNPIERTKSHYLESYYGKILNPHVTLEGIVSNRGNPDHDHFFLYQDLVMTSMYYRQIQRILRDHSMKNILIIEQERMAVDAKSVVADVFRFLEVDEAVEVMNIEKKFNVTSIKRERYTDPIERFKSYRYYSCLSNICPRYIKFLYRKYTSRKVSNSDLTKLSDENILHLKEIFQGDLNDFKNLTGIQISL